MDTIARFVGQQMQNGSGQPVIVENRPGAGSTIGAKAVATADPDGSTLMWEPFRRSRSRRRFTGSRLRPESIRPSRTGG
jgi:hypothetical protein